jgi:type II secretory pathway component PulF
MPTFNYTAVDRNGIQQQALIEADNQASAVEELRLQNLYIMDIKAIGGSLVDIASRKQLISQYMPLMSGQKIFFYRQLSLMLRSGITLLEALDITASLMTGKMVAVCQGLAKSIRNGKNFAEAMSEQGSAFGDLVPHLIRSGEISGELDQILERIAEHTQRRSDLRKELIASLTYPIIVVLATIGVFLMLVMVVVPKVAEFLDKAGKKLPESTQNMVDLRDFIFGSWPLILAVIIIAVSTFVLAYRKMPGFSLMIDSALLKIPVIGKIISCSSMSNVTWSMSMMLRSGITVVQAIEMSSNTISNRAYRVGLKSASEKVMMGYDFGSSLKQTAIPPLVYQMVSIGEKSGSLDTLLEEAATFYEQQLKVLSKTLSSLIEPILIIIIGGMVGYVYLGIIQALLRASGGN